jgi:sulfoxide reductase heme-binding subunit YedZ
VSGNGSTDLSQHFFWLASRALGIAAIVLLSAAVVCGLALSGRFSNRPGGAARWKTLHEALTLTALGTIACHGLALLGDPYLSPSLGQITLPFTLPVQPVWTGLGIIGGWLAAALGLSYYIRRWIGTARWRKLHRWTLLAWGLSVVHTIGLGTDARSPWFLVLLGAAVAPVIALVGSRWISSGRETASGASAYVRTIPHAAQPASKRSSPNASTGPSAPASDSSALPAAVSSAAHASMSPVNS